MTRLGKNNKGEIVDLDAPESQTVTWDMRDYKKAESLLLMRFDDAPFVNTTIQEMQDLLIEKFRDDPEQVERAIAQHFKKRKL